MKKQEPFPKRKITPAFFSTLIILFSPHGEDISLWLPGLPGYGARIYLRPKPSWPVWPVTG